MLKLKLNENTKDRDVIIGDDILVRLLSVDTETGEVEIGINAPKEIIVDRRSIREKRIRRISEVMGLVPSVMREAV